MHLEFLGTQVLPRRRERRLEALARFRRLSPLSRTHFGHTSSRASVGTAPRMHLTPNPETLSLAPLIVSHTPALEEEEDRHVTTVQTQQV